MGDTQLHQPVMIDDKGIEFAVDFVFDRARRKQQVGSNGATDPDNDFTASFHGKLRRQQRFRLDSDDDNKRGISRQAPCVRVFDFNKRRYPGTKPGPDTTHHDHDHGRADHGDNNNQRSDAADKRADDTQHTAVADRPRPGLATSSESRARRHNCGGQHRPARGFQLKVETNKQRQYDGRSQF